MLTPTLTPPRFVIISRLGAFNGRINFEEHGLPVIISEFEPLIRLISSAKREYLTNVKTLWNTEARSPVHSAANLSKAVSRFGFHLSVEVI